MNLTYKQAQAIIEAFGGDETAIVKLATGAGHSGEGIYLGDKDHNEEGSVFLGAEEK